jgi:hypothetical protein
MVVLACLEACRRFKVLQFIYPSLTIRDIITKWTPLNLFFCAMLVTGMAALQTNSLSMIIVSRNIANLILMFGDFCAFGNRPDSIVLSICFMLLAGAVVAAWRQSHLQTTSLGLQWMAGNCVTTVGYILCMKQISKTATTTAALPSAVKLSRFGMVFVNNALCIAFLLPAAYAMGEISLFVETTAIHTSEYATKNLLAGLVTFFFNFALLNCVWQSTECEASHRQAKTIELKEKRKISKHRSDRNFCFLKAPLDETPKAARMLSV